MFSIQELLARQQKRMEEAYQTLKEIMPEFFFRSLQGDLGDLLPMICALSPYSGIRRVDIHEETFFVYLKSEGNNPVEISRRMANRRVAAATVHQSTKPLLIEGKPYTLVVEQYRSELAGDHLPSISLPELQDAYARQFGTGREADLAEAYTRLNASAVADLDADRLAQRLHPALDAQSDDLIHAEIESWSEDSIRLTVSRAIPVLQPEIFSQLIEVADLAGFEPNRAYFRELTRSADPADFRHMAVTVTTLYLKNRSAQPIDADRLEALLRNVRLISWVEMDDILHHELVRRHHFPMPEVDILRAAAEFVHGQLAYIDHNAFNYKDVFRMIALYPELAKLLLAEFTRRFDPAKKKSKTAPSTALAEAVARVNSGDLEKDTLVKTVFAAAGNFIDNILKCNFFVKDKAALAFRLSPDFMNFYRNLGKSYASAFPDDRPCGVFFFHRRKALGYQVRFSEIARGGWRSVIPQRGAHSLEALDNYDSSKDEIFREVFVLAHTQHLKNKDIFEGGAKMITLLEPIADRAAVKPTLWQIQRTVADAFLSLINYDRAGKLREPNIVDRLGGREIIEIGPDENMFDSMIAWLGEYAAKRGYTLGSGIISGKPDTGINHKEYGVTSFGVYQYFLKTLAELGIDPAKDAFSVKIAGGPAGDVAGNAMKLLLAVDASGRPVHPGLKITAVTDGPAAAFDPNGLDRGELLRLLLCSNLDAFDPANLTGEGAYMVFSAPEISADDIELHRLVKRENGKLVESRIGRDDFVRIFQRNLIHYADLFIPAGGRPSTINESNYQDYLPEGRPVFRAIVEGANSYLTPKARTAIEQQGVLIIKDASANKCGVITSSYEILSGLMLDEAEFKADKHELVNEVMEILRRRAVQEADWLYARMHRDGTPLTRLTEQLSREINARNVEISEFLAKHPEFITDALIRSHLPELFTRKYADRLKRLPTEYRLAVAAVELACRMVYASGNADLEARLVALLSTAEKSALKPAKAK